MKWFGWMKRDENRLLADLDALGQLMGAQAAEAKQWYVLDSLLHEAGLKESDLSNIDVDELRMELNRMALLAIKAKERAISAIELDYALRLEPFGSRAPDPVRALAKAVKVADEMRVTAEYDAKIAEIWAVRRENGIHAT
jgi:hypothetical protein